MKLCFENCGDRSVLVKVFQCGGYIFRAFSGEQRGAWRKLNSLLHHFYHAKFQAVTTSQEKEVTS